MTEDKKPSLNDLLSCLYDAVMAPSGYQTFIEMLKDFFDLKATILIIRNVETQEVKGLWMYGMEKKWHESYALEYAPEDMLAHHIQSSPIAHFYASNLDVPDKDKFAETRFYNEWVVPQGMAYATGAIVLQEGAWVTELYLQRGPQHQPFNRDEIDQYNLLIPHLQRAMQMRQRFADLQIGQSFLASSLDVLAMPTFLFNEMGQMAHCNQSAVHLLKESYNLKLNNHYLQTNHDATTRKLSVELSKAVRASRGDESDLNSVILLPRAQQLPLMLMITPLQLKGPVQGAALLFAFDPETTPTITRSLIRRLFGLSEAEAVLSVALCSGKTLDDVALERGTTMNTVKSQLRSIFVKTGTKRQSELVSLLLASPAYFLTQKQLVE
ncbi:MAG: helix-turn-helix transcriptional regulator [Gammaproteobacteria bacterium]|nr:helix-turn-helix transcriptional regulator [Gammaproteobacteria bacterium]